MTDKAVEYHRAKPALSAKTTGLCAQQSEIYAENINQPSASFALDYNVFPVQDKTNSYDSLPALNISCACSGIARK